MHQCSNPIVEGHQFVRRDLPLGKLLCSYKQYSSFTFHVIVLFAACLRGFWDIIVLLFQDASLKTEAGAQLMSEIMEQAEIPLPSNPLKMKNLPSEREFYIPSVDLLTAQVKC